MSNIVLLHLNFQTAFRHTSKAIGRPSYVLRPHPTFEYLSFIVLSIKRFLRTVPNRDFEGLKNIKHEELENFRTKSKISIGMLWYDDTTYFVKEKFNVNML